jgi:rare lipoprotein A
MIRMLVLLLIVAMVLLTTVEAGSCKRTVASYYDRCFGTCHTASGEWFEPDGISAAHRTLPFGTKLKVTNRNNGKTITVRVNDRGPYAGDGSGHRVHPNRGLDLSRGAMRAIGGLQSGVIPVRYCVVQ